MSRYIDAEKLRKEVPLWLDGTCLVMPVDALDEALTADVKPVVHAKWIASERQRFINSDVAATDENGRPFIKKKLVKTVRYKCSSCNEIFDDNSLYCPNCGADMMEEKE